MVSHFETRVVLVEVCCCAKLYCSIEIYPNLTCYGLGGYYGLNLARQLRGSVMPDSDSWYTLWTNLDGSKDGSIYNFTQVLASSMNIGIYDTGIVDVLGDLHLDVVDNCLAGKLFPFF